MLRLGGEGWILGWMRRGRVRAPRVRVVREGERAQARAAAIAPPWHALPGEPSRARLLEGEGLG